MTPYLVLAAAVVALMAFGEGARLHFDRERQIGGHNTAKEPGRTPTWTFFDALAIITLVTFSAVRYNIGSDYRLYAVIYESLDTSDWAGAIADSPQEAGFTILMLMLHSISSSPTVLFWATSILTIIPAYVAIKQVSTRPVLAVVLYILFAFYLTPFNIVRQGVAISLIFLATTCLRRRPVWFAAVCALAVSFHISTIVILAIMWLAHRLRPTLLTVGALALATVAGMVLFNQFAGLGELVGRFNPGYETFLKSTDGTGIGTYLQVLGFITLLAYAALLGRQDRVVAARTGWLMTFSLIGVALLTMSTQALPISRLALFFTIYIVLLLPERVATSQRPAVHDLVLVASGLGFYVLHLAFYGGLVPYQTYLT